MITPIDVIVPFHNALLREMSEIDEAAYGVAAKGGDLAPVVEQLRVLSMVLLNHATAEDEVVFPAIDKIAPGGEGLRFGPP